MSQDADAPITLSTDTVLIRLIDYLRLCGIDIDDALLFKLTALLREGCDANEPKLFDWVLQRLNGRICDTRRLLATTMPPLTRGAIGYDGVRRRGVSR